MGDISRFFTKKERREVIEVEEDDDDGEEVSKVAIDLTGEDEVTKVPMKRRKVAEVSAQRYFDGGEMPDLKNVEEDKTTPSFRVIEPQPRAVTKRLVLEGVSFVLSGVLTEKPERSEVERYIKGLGGRVNTSVSGKTNFLVVGSRLEDGRSVEEGRKFKEASDRQVTVIRGWSKLVEVVQEMEAKQTKVIQPKKKLGITSKTKTIESSPLLKNQLWADRYKPQSTKEVLGNGDVVKKLRLFLEHWDRVHLGPVAKRKKIISSKENPGAKAALLSGPPGIGKTTLAHLVAKEFDYEVLELNASDARSKKTLADALGGALDCPTIKLGAKNVNDMTSKRLVVMDEVDGLSGSDRGGSQELIRLIKLSRVPIICICNDRQSNKVKGLANSCLDLRCKRPMKQTIAKRIISIAEKEGLDLEPNAAELLAENCGNDIRQCLNALQMWSTELLSSSSTATTPNKSITRQQQRASYTAMEARLKNGIEKDAILRATAFDGAKSILSDYERKSHYERTDAFFIDYALAPLLVHENYISAVTSAQGCSTDTKLERVVTASDTLSLSDLVDNRIRMHQNWSLLTAQAALTIKVGVDIQGFCMNPQFPKWFGKNSTTTKNYRLTADLALHLRHRCSASKQTIRLDYLEPLLQHLARPLHTLTTDQTTEAQQENACDQVIDRMDEYGVSRDDLFETMPELLLTKISPIPKLETKTKTKFTKSYNARYHASQALHQDAPAPKKISAKRKRADAEGNVDDDDDDDDEDDDDDTEQDSQPLTAKEAAAARKAFAIKQAGIGAKKKSTPSGAKKSKKVPTPPSTTSKINIANFFSPKS